MGSLGATKRLMAAVEDTLGYGCLVLALSIMVPPPGFEPGAPP